LIFDNLPDGERTEMAATIDGTPDFVDDYTYDAVGNVVSVVEHGVTGGDAVANKEIDLTYNAGGELATVTRYEDGVLAVEGDYTYDANGNLTGLVYHQGDTVLASYAWTYSSDGSPLLSGEGQGEGAFVWLPSGGIVPVHDTTGVTAALSSGGFAGLAEVTSCTSADGTANYSYDPTGELLAAAYTGGQAAESYTYDANGNRTMAGYVTGVDNRLLCDGTYTYAYDAEGNRTEKFIDTNHDGVLDAGDTDVTEFTWDNRDRLTEVDHFTTYTNYADGTSDQIVTYGYDAFNRLIRRTLDADGSSGTGDIERSVYVYDGNQITLQFDKTSADGFAGAFSATALSVSGLSASDLSHRYLWNSEAVDQLFADEDVADGQLLYALTDRQGSVRDLASYDSETDTTTVANHRIYDAYGNLTSQTNAAVDCIFGYTGRQFDNDTGLQINDMGAYSPAIGRTTSENTNVLNGSNANPYCCVADRPVGLSDPTGCIVVIVNNPCTPADPRSPLNPANFLPATPRYPTEGPNKPLYPRGHQPSGGFLPPVYLPPERGGPSGGTRSPHNPANYLPPTPLYPTKGANEPFYPAGHQPSGGFLPPVYSPPKRKSP
jgi:RHS repeat-associated protein